MKLIEEKLVETTSKEEIQAQIERSLQKLAHADSFDIDYQIAPFRNLVPRPSVISLYLTAFVVEQLIKHRSVEDIYGSDKEIYNCINRQVAKFILQWGLPSIPGLSTAPLRILPCSYRFFLESVPCCSIWETCTVLPPKKFWRLPMRLWPTHTWTTLSVLIPCCAPSSAATRPSTYLALRTFFETLRANLPAIAGTLSKTTTTALFWTQPRYIRTVPWPKRTTVTKRSVQAGRRSKPLLTERSS